MVNEMVAGSQGKAHRVNGRSVFQGDTTLIIGSATDPFGEMVRMPSYNLGKTGKDQ